MEATAPSAPAPAVAETNADAAEAKPVDGKEQEGGEAKADKKPEAPAPKRYKLPKDDGTEEEVDESEAKRRYSHAREANKRMEEAAKVRKQAESFIEKFIEDPMAILDNPNVAQRLKKPLRQMLEERLAQDLRKEIDPEGWDKQQKVSDREAKARQWEEHQAKQKADADEAEVTKLSQRYAEEYDGKLKAVLETAGLPRTTNVVRRAAQLMQVAVKNGYEPDLGMIIDQVRDEYHGDTKSLYGALNGDQLIALFGEDIANKIRKADLARLRKPAASAPSATREDAERKPRESQKKLNPREFLEAAMKRAGV